MLELLPIVMLVLALAGRLGRRQVLYAIGLFAMIMLQSIFVAVRVDLPVVAALHPVNGFGILLVGIAAAREAWPTHRAAHVSVSTASAPARGDAVGPSGAAG
jgi:hypothetical protein